MTIARAVVIVLLVLIGALFTVLALYTLMQQPPCDCLPEGEALSRDPSQPAWSRRNVCAVCGDW